MLECLVLFVLLGGVANMKGYPGAVVAVLLIAGACPFDREGAQKIVDATWDIKEWAKWKLNGER